MKKLFANILCLTIALQIVCSLTVFAADTPVSIHFSAPSPVNPGEEATLIIDTVINPGFDIQGVQVDFDFSDNFPALKNTSIIKNTTAWENSGISENNLLALGNVITKQSQLVAKITFVVPSDALPGTEYVFTPNAIAANADREVEVKLSAESVKFVVAGSNLPVPTPAPAPTPTPAVPGGSSSSGKTPSGGKDTDDKTDVVLPWKNPFSDVKESDWFYNGVRYVFEKNLMSGVDVDQFAPNTPLTRAMLVTILYRFDGSPESMTYSYTDVPRKTWYTKGIDWAASIGIVNGVGDNKFAPNAPVTREQITVIFYNYTKYQQMDISARGDLSKYTDKGEISAWAQTAFEWAAATGLVSGKGDNKLDPTGKATRAEASAILQRYAENIIKK